jgi:hypothetical protein
MEGCERSVLSPSLLRPSYSYNPDLVLELGVLFVDVRDGFGLVGLIDSSYLYS